MSRRRRKPRPGLRAAAAGLVVLGVFLVGMAVGAALEGDPDPSTTTYERTLRFATVTVTAP